MTQTLGGHVFQRIKFILGILVKGRLWTISTKLYSNRASRAFLQDFKSFFHLVAIATRIRHVMGIFPVKYGEFHRMICCLK